MYVGIKGITEKGWRVKAAFVAMVSGDKRGMTVVDSDGLPQWRSQRVARNTGGDTKKEGMVRVCALD